MMRRYVASMSPGPTAGGVSGGRLHARRFCSHEPHAVAQFSCMYPGFAAHSPASAHWRHDGLASSQPNASSTIRMKPHTPHARGQRYSMFALSESHSPPAARAAQPYSASSAHEPRVRGVRGGVYSWRPGAEAAASPHVPHDAAHCVVMNAAFLRHSPSRAHCAQLSSSSAHVWFAVPKRLARPPKSSERPAGASEEAGCIFGDSHSSEGVPSESGSISASLRCIFGLRILCTSPHGPAIFTMIRGTSSRGLRRLLQASAAPRLGARASSSAAHAALGAKDRFEPRHLGPREGDVQEMLDTVGVSTVDELIRKTVPSQIMLDRALDLGKYSPGLSESDAIAELRRIVSANKVNRSFIGMGYYDTKTPYVILRNVLENPGWYTQYTPYQPEVSQGRLESLMNFQTMVTDLTGFELCNASLLDEGTAAAEAMAMIHAGNTKKPKFFVDERVHPQTLAIARTRSAGLGIEVVTGDYATFAFGDDVCGALVQYPATDGSVIDYKPFAEKAAAAGAKLAVATDLLALTSLTPPAEFGADIAVGSAQRFGVPLGYGGPHAGFLSTNPKMARKMPGRIIGMSIDAQGKPVRNPARLSAPPPPRDPLLSQPTPC